MSDESGGKESEVRRRKVNTLINGENGTTAHCCYCHPETIFQKYNTVLIVVGAYLAVRLEVELPELVGWPWWAAGSPSTSLKRNKKRFKISERFSSLT